MASLSHPDSRRKYSWWWDSHISPKNSKWLQENLTDMDAKVKQMIKLIEEDADSFARRAEMYYKKRPELMKLVEEFYRAYRALAERYDHATGALRQAQRTMAEAFPNQVPFLTDDSPAGSSAEAEPHTPEMPPAVRAFFEPDELQKDALGLSSSHFHAVKRNGAFTEEPDSVSSKKGLKQLNDLFGSGDAPNIAKFAEGRARKGLNFHDADEKERNVQNTDKVSRAQEDSKGLNERAGKAENEVQTLKEALTKLEAERETSLLQYQQCLERISDLERTISHSQEDAGKLNERASKSEVEAAALKQDLARVESEKEGALLQYKQCLEKISDLESKLRTNHSLQFELESLAQKLGAQCEELTEKQKELGRLWTSIQEERLRFMEAETTFQSLQHLHSQSQEELRSLATELQSKGQILKDMETHNQGLQDEVHKVKEENRGLNEFNLSSAKLLEKNALLENSLSDLSAELEGLREKVKALEESYQSLLGEKSILIHVNENQQSIVQKLVLVTVLEQLGLEATQLATERNTLDEECRIRSEQFSSLQSETHQLLESENELNTVRSFADQLNHEIENGRDILSRKETELLEAGQKLSALQDEKAELHKTVEVVKSECDEVKVIREDQEKQILKLSEENDHQKKQNGCLLNKLEGENGGLKTQLAAYTPTIICLRDSVAALENRTLSHTNLHQADTKDKKDAKLVGHLHVERSQDCSENQIAMVPEGNSDLQDLQTRIKAIEKGLIEMERLALEEHLDTNAKLEAAMKQIEELKSQRSFRRENIQTSRHLNPQQEEEELGDGTCDDRKLHTKDIMLDQISECSSYGISRRETAEVDDQMLELWETTDLNGKIMVEKELGVDKLEISKRFVEPGQEGNKRKTLERLASDAQKLTNLQITVQDLKKKVQFTEDSRNVKGIEYDTVKGQLEEVEGAILKLCDSNSKLTKNIEDNSLSDGKPAMELEESRSVRRGRISEQARKGSEKIGRLQLEVQRIQFLLLKLDDEKESKAKTRISEPKRRVLLRDYLYGGRRTTHKRKKAHFCSCVQSPTTGD
ncbi:unnamed protein product, partial [Vitis vinifera]